MDATQGPHQFPPEMYSYVETNSVFALFSDLLEHLAIDLPDNPIVYLYELLVKSSKASGYHATPKVYVLGPPVADRKLVSTTLALKFNLVHLTTESLKGSPSEGDPSSSEWITLVKDRLAMPDCCKRGWIMEGFPRKRDQSFLLRQAGIFPSHIVVLDDPSLTTSSMAKDFRLGSKAQFRELADFLSEKPLMVQLHRTDYLKTFNLKANEPQVLLKKVTEFVRRSKKPPVPYIPRAILLGPYGSGRRTLATKLATGFNLVQVDFREELRRAAMKDSPIKAEIEDLLKMQAPIPDELLARIMANRLKTDDCTTNGWVMYNFPQSLNQAQHLKKHLEGFQVNRVIFLEADLETCMERVEPRRFDTKTGCTYHLLYNKPELPHNVSQSRLFQRPEDSKESVISDHATYTSEKLELARFYAEEFPEDIAFHVDAEWPEGTVLEEVQNVLLRSAKLKVEQSIE